MKSTFAFCLQLPEDEMKTAFIMMQTWLLNKKNGDTHLAANHFMPTICEFRVSGSKKMLSRFKEWITEFPHVDNAFSHYIVANPKRKEYEPIEISAVETTKA